MKPRVYIETTVVSYLTAWPSRDLVRAAQQQITHEWWQTYRGRFDLFSSQLVMLEASAGDAQAASERLQVLANLTLLEAAEPAVRIGEYLVQAGALPPSAQRDALHVGLGCDERNGLSPDLELPAFG